jgi:hypothetical protein
MIFGLVSNIIKQIITKTMEKDVLQEEVQNI